MPIPSPYTTPLELRMHTNGKMMLFFDGKRIPGVLEIKTEWDPGQRTAVTVTIIGNAVRFATDEREPVPEGVYYSPWYPGFYAQDGSGEMGAAFMRKWIDRKDDFPNE